MNSGHMHYYYHPLYEQLTQHMHYYYHPLYEQLDTAHAIIITPSMNS